MNRKQLVFIIILIATGCNKTKNKLEYQICKDSIQYWRWEFYDYGIKHAQIFRFDKNMFAQYYIDKDGNARQMTCGDNIVVYLKWSVSNDSVLTMNSSKSKILKWTEDTIFIGSLKKTDKSIDTVYRLDESLKVINKGDPGDTLKNFRTMAPI
jgi:hypothetical protein